MDGSVGVALGGTLLGSDQLGCVVLGFVVLGIVLLGVVELGFVLLELDGFVVLAVLLDEEAVALVLSEDGIELLCEAVDSVDADASSPVEDSVTGISGSMTDSSGTISSGTGR